jgi:broad specificity phosphatase PhoE
MGTQTGPDLSLYLLRHGESVANVERVFAARKVDPALSEAGRRQVRGQIGMLRGVRFDACYASPLLRTRQSAAILSEALGLRFVEADALREVDVGRLDGQPQADARNRAVYEDVVQSWEQGLASAAFPGGESLDDVRARFAGLLGDLARRPERSVLLVGHCLLFMCVIWLFAGSHGPTFESGHMGRGALSVLRGGADGLVLAEFNALPPG